MKGKPIHLYSVKFQGMFVYEISFNVGIVIKNGSSLSKGLFSSLKADFIKCVSLGVPLLCCRNVSVLMHQTCMLGFL